MGGAGGIGAILGVLGSGQAATTALQVAQLQQQFQQQEQNAVLTMGLNQYTFEQQEFSEIGSAITSQQQLQAKTTQGFFKTQAGIAGGWISALGSAAGGG
jgi:hypothetical protein